MASTIINEPKFLSTSLTNRSHFDECKAICVRETDAKLSKWLEDILIEREDLALMKQLHQQDIEELEKARRELESKVLNINIPVVKQPKLFQNLSDEASELEKGISKHGDECYAIANLKRAVADIKVKIELLVEDNAICLGWMGASAALAGVSVGVAFIPVVGLIISPVIASTPYLGKLIHRLTVSYNRKKHFGKKKKI